jgi:hypothetical protein
MCLPFVDISWGFREELVEVDPVMAVAHLEEALASVDLVTAVWERSVGLGAGLWMGAVRWS